MVKKTLLSVAIAASVAALAGCNVSTTDKHDDSVNTSFVKSADPSEAKKFGPTAEFSPAMSVVPTSIDILFAKAATTDGTAATEDTKPPVTTAINDLTGFSTNSTIDIPFSGKIDEATLAGNVHLIKLNNKAYNSAIDALDIASIVIASPIVGQKPTGEPIFNPIDASGPQYGTDYVAEVVPMDNGSTSMVRLQLLKPLDPKTKYIVAVTDGIKGENGKPVTQSASYKSLLAGNKQFSDALDALVPAVQAWDGIASGYEQKVAGLMSRDANKVVLSYGMTTEGTTDVLLAMAAPENYIYGLLDDVATMEKLMPAAAIGQIMTGVATALNAGITEEADKINIEKMLLSDDALKNESPSVQLKATLDKRTVRIHPAYKDALSKNLAKAIVDGGAASTAVDMMQGDPTSQATINGAINNWNSNHTDKQIPANPAEWTSAHKSYVAQALGQYDDNTTTATLIVSAANGAGKLLKDVVHRPAARAVTTITSPVTTGLPNNLVAVPNSSLGLPTPTLSIQAMIKLPQFMQRKTDDGQSFWRGSASVGAVIDAALGKPTGTTPPKDDDGTLNVSYRFPFAEYVEDVAVPVLVTYPLPDTLGGDCTKPGDGWKTIIFQHGITTDRTASLGFANQMAAATAGCYATVAIDMVAHGVDASTTDRNGNPVRYKAFNGFNVAGYINADAPTSTPFAATLKGLADANMTTFAGLEERHQNLATNALNEVVPMSFTPDSESGNSGDLFINLTNFQQTRDHLRQTVMDMLNLNASIKNIDIDGNGTGGDLDPDNVYFVGHSLGAITGMTFVAVNNAVANNLTIVDKELNPIKAAVFGNPGGQLTKLLENSPSFSAKIIPGLAAKGVTQGSTNMEKFYSILQATVDTVDPINFTKLLKGTNTPVLMFEMVGGGAVAASDRNTDSGLGPVTGLPDALIAAGGYPADTVVPNNANPALNDVLTGVSNLAGTDPLVKGLELTTLSASGAVTLPGVVAKFKEGTHGTISSADAVTVFAELIQQTASFLGSDGAAVAVGDDSKLDTTN